MTPDLLFIRSLLPSSLTPSFVLLLVLLQDLSPHLKSLPLSGVMPSGLFFRPLVNSSDSYDIRAGAGAAAGSNY